MNLMDKLRRRFRWFGIPNLMIYITATMLAVFLLDLVLPLRPSFAYYMAYSTQAVLQGQIWRIITFAFLPPTGSVIFIALVLYFYYFIGSSLENAWGANRFTIYYLCGIIGALIAGVLTGGATNYYLNLSLFFAFASLWPDHQIMLFFIIPVKIKWLAWLNWAFFLYSFLTGSMVTKFAIVFSLINYFIFFGPDIFSDVRARLRSYKRRQEFRRNFRNNPWN